MMPLYITRLRFHFVARDLLQMPSYPGSALRGVFGHALHQVGCVTYHKDCTVCMVRNSCVYPTLFETPTSERGLFGEQPPHPLIFDFSATRNSCQPGESFTLNLHLVGSSLPYTPFLIQAWQRAGERGLGLGHARFALQRVEREECLGSEQWRDFYLPQQARVFALAPAQVEPPPLPSGELKIALVSPLRTKLRGKLVGAAEFTPQLFLRALLKRLVHLQHCHQKGSEPLDLPALSSHLATLPARRQRLYWKEWSRYSSRQEQRMQLGGLMGDFSLEAAPLAALWPLLWLGQWAHVGKNTIFGLGGYRIVEG